MGAGDAPRPYVSLAGLRARGWTAGIVRQLLGEPDQRGVNPVFRSAPRTRLYLMERVERAERGADFVAAAAAAARRSTAASAAAARRREEVLARIRDEPIDVPRWRPDRLARRAVAHRNQRDEERSYERWGHAPEPASIDDADQGALARWQVNFLRHQLTRYDELLDGLHGRTGRAAAESLLRRRIYAAIAEAYPSLAHECDRQLREREGGPPAC